MGLASLAFLYATFLVIRTLILGIDVPGYASLMVVTLFIGSCILIGIGIIGEYLSRIYSEIKQRPIYLTSELVGLNQNNATVAVTSAGQSHLNTHDFS